MALLKGNGNQVFQILGLKQSKSLIHSLGLGSTLKKELSRQPSPKLNSDFTLIAD